MMRLYSRAETAKKLGIGLATLDRLRAEGKIGFYQQRPNCKVQFTQVHIGCHSKLGRYPLAYSKKNIRTSTHFGTNAVVQFGRKYGLC